MIYNKKRYHIDNSFMDSPLDFSPFNLYQLCDLACNSDYEVGIHYQKCHEISYIVSGEGIFMRNNVSYNVKEGMLFLTAYDDSHYIRSSKNNPLRYVCIAFDFQKDTKKYQNFIPIENFFNELINPVATDLYHIYNTFALLISEFSNADAVSDAMITANISQIICLTYRSFHNQPQKYYFENLEINDTKPLVYEIISYIDTNFSTIEKLSDFSNWLGYSYGYISKIFSKAMGMTINEYYNRRRFEKANDLLTGDESLTTIAYQLGFANPQCFSKAFKKHFGISPGEYRKNNKEHS